MVKTSKLALVALFVPMLVLGTYKAEAAPAGSIEGGNIYTVSVNGSAVTYSVRVTNTGATTMRNVTVTATMPTDGSSTATICADNATPHCTSDEASAPTSGGLRFVSGSAPGGTGQIFNGLDLGNLAGGQERTVQFEMRRITPQASASTTFRNSPGTAAATTSFRHTNGVRRIASVSQTTEPQNKRVEESNNQTLPTVESNAGDVNAEENSGSTSDNSANSTAQGTTASEDTGKGADNTLSTSGSEAGMGALALGAIAAGAYFYRRSRRELVDTLLSRA